MAYIFIWMHPQERDTYIFMLATTILGITTQKAATMTWHDMNNFTWKFLSKGLCNLC
jgi:hypothetical protein